MADPAILSGRIAGPARHHPLHIGKRYLGRQADGTAPQIGPSAAPVFGGKLKAAVDGINGAACPIQLI